MNIIVKCPHCEEFILIDELNCCIFRHGTFINETHGNQIDPHASKELCDYYISNKLIYGCGKPFKIYKNEISTEPRSENYIAIKCDYI